MVVSTPSLGNLINLINNKPEFGEGKFMFAESLETRCSKQSGYDVYSSIKILTKSNFNAIQQKFVTPIEDLVVDIPPFDFHLLPKVGSGQPVSGGSPSLEGKERAI